MAILWNKQSTILTVILMLLGSNVYAAQIENLDTIIKHMPKHQNVLINQDFNSLQNAIQKIRMQQKITKAELICNQDNAQCNQAEQILMDQEIPAYKICSKAYSESFIRITYNEPAVRTCDKNDTGCAVAKNIVKSLNSENKL